MAYFVADEKLQGYYVSGGVTINIVKYHFECDDAASLPAQTAFISSKNIKISMASTAHTLSDNKIFEMNSAGTWKDMTNSPSTYDAADIVYDNAISGMAATNVQEAIDEISAENANQQQEIDYAVNTGVKNLLHFNAIGSGGSVYGNTYTHNGITYTLNTDMTVTATGTASSSANSYAYLILNGTFAPIDNFCDGEHIVSGCPANGSTSKYRMYITQAGWGSLNETGNGAIIPDKGSYTGLLIACFVSKGYAIPAGEPLVFKPMIRSAKITDSSFQPYAKTNRELTVENASQQAEINYGVNDGAKNIFNIQAPAAEQRITTILNPDGGITISCTSAVWATRNVIAEIPAGDYICSLFVDAVTIGGGEFGFFVNQSNDQGTWTELARQTSITSTGRTDKFISVSQKYLRISININNSNISATNSATIRLMLRHAAITDPTFQPYAPTNRELYDMILALQ